MAHPEAPATRDEVIEAFTRINEDEYLLSRTRVAEDLSMFFEKYVEPIPFSD